MQRSILMLPVPVLMCLWVIGAESTMPGKKVVGKCSFFEASENSAICKNPGDYYIAMRWDYRALMDLWRHKTMRETLDRLAECRVILSKKGGSQTIEAVPCDWGPAKWTKRVMDLSPKIGEKLGLKTDDTVVAVLVDTKRKRSEETADVVRQRSGDGVVVQGSRGGEVSRKSDRSSRGFRNSLQTAERVSAGVDRMGGPRRPHAPADIRPENVPKRSIRLR